jgi:hypothetical protein
LSLTINCEGLTLGPRDVLVAHVDGAIDPITFSQVRDLLVERFPGNDVIVLAAGATLESVGRDKLLELAGYKGSLEERAGEQGLVWVPVSRELLREMNGGWSDPVRIRFAEDPAGNPLVRTIETTRLDESPA